MTTPLSKKRHLLPPPPLVMECDDLEWFVNILGTDTLMQKAVELTTGEADAHWEDLGRRGIRETDPDGLYFRTGHWYSKKNGSVANSYPRSANLQISGTSHFCQTFALLLYTEQLSDLIPGSYAHNIQVAVRFWLRLLRQHPDLLAMMMDEIHMEYRDVPTMHIYSSRRSRQVRHMNSQNLLEYLEDVITNAPRFIGCREG